MNVSEWVLIQYTGRRHWQDRIMMKVIAASQGIYDSPQHWLVVNLKYHDHSHTKDIIQTWKPLAQQR